MKIRLTFILMLFSLLLIIAGCSESDSNMKKTNAKEGEKRATNQSDQLDMGDYEVMLGGQVKEEGDQFIVEGTSNLLPGARIIGEVVVDDGETVFSDTSELVEEDGSFTMKLDHHRYGEAAIIIRFDFENVQEDEIKRHYGDKGQNLKGPFIYKHQGPLDNIFNKAEAIVYYHPDGDNDLTIQAPNWRERPEDYGEPRVWLDIEEIKEDGDHFYIKGISNLLEGSIVKVNYTGNTGQTAVLPDGSFQFKINYEYAENEEFVFTFNPRFQWDEIEKVYGEKGQRLIGEYVEVNRHGDEQWIERHIPWDNSGNKSKTDEEKLEDARKDEQDSEGAKEDKVNNKDEQEND